MVDLTAARFNEYLAAASIDPNSDAAVERANEQSPYAPNGVYPVADGWIALSVDGDDEFAALVAVLAAPALAAAGFDRADDRRARRQELDEQLADATRLRASGELARELRGVGIAAERVASPADLLDDSDLAARGIFAPVCHPTWGERRLIGIPWRPFGEAALPLGAPPLLQSEGVGPPDGSGP